MRTLTLIAALVATPAFAAGGKPFFSLANTDFIVSLGFIVFIGVLLYFRVPGMLAGMLDKRADQIRSELEEARALREEAQTVLAGYERKQEEVKAQSERIIEHAKEEARQAAELAKADIAESIERRLKAAEDQIASAEASALREVKDRAVQIAVAAAGEVIAKSMTKKDAGALIDQSIDTVEAKLH